jgi:hypothetical protein
MKCQATLTSCETASMHSVRQEKLSQQLTIIKVADSLLSHCSDSNGRGDSAFRTTRYTYLQDPKVFQAALERIATAAVWTSRQADDHGEDCQPAETP